MDWSSPSMILISWFLDYYKQELVFYKWLRDGKETKNMLITHDSLLFVWRPQSWLALNFTAIKSKLYNFWWPSRGLTSNPCHYTYICFLGRNLDSRTTMLRITRHSEYIIHESPLFHEFSRFTLCLTINSRITRNPFQTLCFVSVSWYYLHCTSSSPFSSGDGARFRIELMDSL